MKTRLSLRQLIVTMLCVLTLAASFVHAQPPALGSHAPVAFENMQIFSPDKQSVAYVTSDDLGMTNSTIWIAKPDGTEKMAVATAGENFSVTSPIWSPDSRQIAYVKMVNTVQDDFGVMTNFEIWVVNTDGSGNQLVSDSHLFNPVIEFGGKTDDIRWEEQDTIEFINRSAYPGKRYAISVASGEVQEIGSLPLPLAARPALGAKLPLNVPLFKQCDGRWGWKQLGWCAGKSICHYGCAISAVSMVLAYYGANVNPDMLNTWLKSHNGYANGCNLYWYTPLNYHSGVSLEIVSYDPNRIKYELDRCYPVIVHVTDSPKGQHYVVVTGYSGNTFFINDSGFSNTTLDAYKGRVRMLIYRGPVNCCPSISLNALPKIPCLPRDGSGIYYSAQLEGFGGRAPYSYKVVSGSIPQGLSLSSSGKLSGTLNFEALGTHNFTIKATDADGCGGTRSYRLIVEKCPCPPMSISTVEQPACLPHDGTGIYYQQQLVAEGVTEPYAFTVTGGELPAGLTFSPDGKIAGRLDKTQEGSYSLEVTVSDSCDCATTRVMPINLYSCTLEFTDWQIDVNGELYEDGGFLPDGLDDSEFDWHSGLGTLTFKFEPGVAGDYSINATFDYLFASLYPERFDLYEGIVGTPAENQLLEIEREQYDLNVDLGWDFKLGSAGDYAEITFLLGEKIIGEDGSVLPYAEFLFSDTTDFTGNCEGDLQFTSKLFVTPEPGTLVLLGLGLFGLLIQRRRRAKK